MSDRAWPRRFPAAPLVAVATSVLVLAGCGGSSTGASAGRSTGASVQTEPVTGRSTASTASTSAPPSTPSSTTPSSTPPTSAPPSTPSSSVVDGRVRTGAEVLLDGGVAPLVGRRVGLIANRASTVGGRRLIDVLHEHPEVDLVALFAPEHGVSGGDDAGAVVADGTDPATGVTVHSLYGAERAPTAEVLAGLDLLVFDLQDVGARFYTYTATLGLAMQAAAEAGVPVLVLDRPNPLGGDRPDGPVRDDEHRSFVSLYPVPALHGLTTGELALAIRGEGWLDGVADVDLDVVALQGWDRSQRWADTGLTWSPPSPGLPTAELSLLYPATVLLEATTVSFGRGTDRPFGQFGAPWLDAEALAADLEAAGLAGVRFEPTTFVPDDGAEAVPGVRLEVTDPVALRPLAVGVHVLDGVLDQAGDRPVIDRPDFLDLLAGGSALRRGLLAGRDPDEIVGTWSDDLADWATTSAPYLLYPPAGG